MGTNDVTMTYLGNIYKTEKTPEGHLLVYGKAAGNELDLDEQRCDPAWLKAEMPDWFKWANVREQHTQLASGVGKELEEDGAGGWHLKSLIVDKGTIAKVEAGVLKGYSIGVKGGRTMKSATAPKGLIVAGKIVEISLVDRPANPNATITICKAAGSGTLLPVDEAGEELEVGAVVKWLTADLFKSAGETVNDVLEGEYEGADVDDALPAIHTVADKLIAEAMMLKSADLSKPYDISGLIGAANALEMFLDTDTEAVSEELNIAKRFFSTEERTAVEHEGHAMPGGKYPIENGEDLSNAIRLAGHGSAPASEIHAHIKKRARELGLESKIPDTWKSASIDHAETADMVKAAVAEVNKAWEAKFETLSDELAKVKATPVPFGPVVIPPRTVPMLNKSSRADQLAQTANQPGLDPELARLYTKAAQERAQVS